MHLTSIYNNSTTQIEVVSFDDFGKVFSMK